MLDAITVTEPAPGGTNDDYLLVAARWAIVLDGISAYPVPDVGCRHSVSWYVAHLAGHLGTGLASGPQEESLQDILALAIEQTMMDHGPDCDLTNPLTPGATVAAVRAVGDELQWIVLGDATAAWQLVNGETKAMTDDQADHLVDAPIVNADVRRYDPAYVGKIRNQPGGFWVAAADPEVAKQALTGAVPIESVAKVGLFSDGVTRLVERYGWSWARLLDEAQHNGPRSLVEAVREAERTDPNPDRWREKPHDDATAVVAIVR